MREKERERERERERVGEKGGRERREKREKIERARERRELKRDTRGRPKSNLQRQKKVKCSRDPCSTLHYP